MYFTQNIHKHKKIGSTTSNLNSKIGTKPKYPETVTFTTKSTKSSYIMAIVEGRGSARGEIGLSVLDLKGCTLILCQISDNIMYSKLGAYMNVYNPIEILLPNTFCDSVNPSNLLSFLTVNFEENTITSIPRKEFNESLGLTSIKRICLEEYQQVEYEISTKYYCLSATAALISYIESIQKISFMDNSLKVTYKHAENTVLMDNATMKILELLLNNCNPSEPCSLFELINKTRTTAGDKLLRANILQPLTDLSAILERQLAVEEIMNNEEIYTNFESILSKVPDIEHFTSLLIQIPKLVNMRYIEARINATIYLKHTLEIIPELLKGIEKCKSSLLASFLQVLRDSKFSEILELLMHVVHHDANLNPGYLNMRTQKVFTIKPSVNGLLDIARRTYIECIDDISELVKQLSEKHDTALKPCFNKSRGFYIQMICQTKNSALNGLPSEFLQCSLKNNIMSFTTMDLIRLNSRVNESLNEIYYMTYDILLEYLMQFKDKLGCLFQLSECIGMMDMLFSFAKVSILNKFVKPLFSAETAIIDAYHPILLLCQRKKNEIVKNNIISNKYNSLNLLTGPNMSGKSTYLKMIGCIYILAQMGCFIPCSSAKIRLTSNILTRMSNNDIIERNASTFTVEMKELSFIMNSCGEDSIILIDELGRGTGIAEGISICIATLEYLAKTSAYTWISTHFSEVCLIEGFIPVAINYHFYINYMEKDERNHKMIPGFVDDVGYGLKLARLSKLPQDLLETAEEIFNKIKNQMMCSNKTNELSNLLLIRRTASKLKQLYKESVKDDTSLEIEISAIIENFKTHYIVENSQIRAVPSLIPEFL